MSIESVARDVRESVPEPIWLSGQGTRIVSPLLMRTVKAPAGIRSFTPEEMTVECGAGTDVDDLAGELASAGQYVNLPIRPAGSGTVGGALSVGEGDVMRLGRGAVRDVLLRADFVDGRGTAIRAGGPTVKNVSGFDLCRLLVGSCGRIGFLAEVILRTRPLPLSLQWFTIPDTTRHEISIVMREIPKPSSLLWSGREAMLCLEGHPDDLAEMKVHLEKRLGRILAEREVPDLTTHPYRSMCRPGDIDDIVAKRPDRSLVEVGTGVVHLCDPGDDGPSDEAIARVEGRILEAFDPDDRMNGGSAVWGTSHQRRILVSRQ